MPPLDIKQKSRPQHTICVPNNITKNPADFPFSPMLVHVLLLFAIDVRCSRLFRRNNHIFAHPEVIYDQQKNNTFTPNAGIVDGQGKQPELNTTGITKTPIDGRGTAAIISQVAAASQQQGSLISPIHIKPLVDPGFITPIPQQIKNSGKLELVSQGAPFTGLQDALSYPVPGDSPLNPMMQRFQMMKFLTDKAKLTPSGQLLYHPIGIDSLNPLQPNSLPVLQPFQQPVTKRLT